MLANVPSMGTDFSYTRVHLLRTLYAIRRERVPLGDFDATYRTMSEDVNETAALLNQPNITEFLVQHSNKIKDAGVRVRVRMPINVCVWACGYVCVCVCVRVRVRVRGHVCVGE